MKAVAACVLAGAAVLAGCTPRTPALAPREPVRVVDVTPPTVPVAAPAPSDPTPAPAVGGIEEMLGASSLVHPAKSNVVLVMSGERVRAHKTLSRLAPVLTWRWSLAPASGSFDPIGDADWIAIYGPSLVHTEKDVVLVGHRRSDATAETTLADISAQYTKGASIDTRVPKVKAWLAWVDHAERVLMTPAHGLVAMVPPSHAHEAAATFQKAPPSGPRDAVRLLVDRPAEQIRLPDFALPESVERLDAALSARDDGGVDLHVDCEAENAKGATETVNRTNSAISGLNRSLAFRLATRGLFVGAAAVSSGRHATLDVHASPEQVTALVQLAAAWAGVQTP